MKIALITETFPPEVNGVAMTLHRLVTGLHKRGNHMTVVRPRQEADKTRREEKDYEEILVKGYSIPRYQGLQFGVPARRRLKAVWRKEKPDLIHIATEGPLGYSALGAADDLNIPTISTFHTNFHSYGDHYGYGFFTKPLMRFFKYFHNRTGATYVPSDEVKEELEEQGINNVRILSRGVDTELFTPARRSEKLRTEWGVEPSTPVVLYVGRVANEKNIPLTVKAFTRFKELEPNAKLVIVGDGPERKNLEKEHPDIHFAGMRKGEDLAAHYASGDFFFFGSVTETFGNVVTEAMASGLIVLCYDYAAGKRHIVNGENGFTAPYKDEAGFLKTIEQVTNAKPLWPTIAEAANRTAADISWAKIIAKFEEELREFADVKE
ncbi:glycosyltransferase family 1 protein [Rubellicoccus peritrichatus]|uniref:Glycosyltransferase family 1 protein n=1 Tax=Rubellicoccus peritrichatus TaxID=3080537 RepID=A0AAQ3LCA7_9BACT|nr:glycosyltransferase family 1 protein [Puniceicoccus sp. CR14]WOO42806.1 glycosyltransferase family 1 protein [Puniceicoccus sp. CR14]